MEHEIVKSCRNCKWVKRDWILGYDYAKCTSPHAYGSKINPVSGLPSSEFCSIERGHYGPIRNCGQSGKFFEPRPSREPSRRFEKVSAFIKKWW